MQFTFNGGCFTYLFAGIIAGTIATFVVRGRLGCIVVNFGLGIVGAVVANFILNLFAPLLVRLNIPNSADFFGITVFASIAATLVAFLFNMALKAEGRHQQHLLDKHRDDPRFQEPATPAS
jgi:uncharacterized membrane protein YeaQ/YmgE (transglycosylase-associated protein family)